MSIKAIFLDRDGVVNKEIDVISCIQNLKYLFVIVCFEVAILFNLNETTRLRNII